MFSSKKRGACGTHFTFIDVGSMTNMALLKECELAALTIYKHPTPPECDELNRQ